MSSTVATERGLQYEFNTAVSYVVMCLFQSCRILGVKSSHSTII